MASKHYTLSFILKPELLQVIKDRAQFNLRSMAKEATFLIETGLAACTTDLRTIHKLAEALAEDRLTK